MSKNKVIILGTMVLLLTMCCNFGALTERVMDKALEEADLPEGALETVQAMPEVIGTEAVGAADDLADSEAGEAMDEALNQLLEEATEAMEGADPSQIPYPMPGDAQIYDYSGGMVTFQANMNVAGVVAFYRQELTARGYTERTINTVVSDEVANLVFDGDPSGNALVVQVTGMGDMSIVNVRLEDV